jgi:hypothetical protein
MVAAEWTRRRVDTQPVPCLTGVGESVSWPRARHGVTCPASRYFREAADGSRHTAAPAHGAVRNEREESTRLRQISGSSAKRTGKTAAAATLQTPLACAEFERLNLWPRTAARPALQSWWAPPESHPNQRSSSFPSFSSSAGPLAVCVQASIERPRPRPRRGGDPKSRVALHV